MSDIKYLRDRYYSLIVGKGSDAVEINNLQITFDVTKTSSNKDKKNSATVEIYNLSETQRRKLEENYIQVVLSAGYYDTGLTQLFSGQCISVRTSKLSFRNTKRSGTDLITTLEISEFYKEMNGTIVSQIVPAGLTVKDAILTTIKDIPEITRQEITGDVSKTPLPNGYPSAGTPQQILDSLSKSYDFEWQIDNGVLYVSDNQSSSPVTGSVLSFGQWSGLIDRPEFVDEESKIIKREVKGKNPKVNPKKNAIKFKVLLAPSIIAGSTIHLDFEDMTGYYRVDEVTHKGDFRGNEWYSEVRCTERLA